PGLQAERPMPPALAPAAAAEAALRGAIILDTRSSAEYGAAHPAGALHVSLDGQYASWVGTLARPEQELVVAGDPARFEEAVMRLARVGYENVIGVLDGGV